MVKVLQMGRKHCEKRRNCSLRAISPFLTVFSEDLYGRHVKPDLVWKRVNTKLCFSLFIFYCSLFRSNLSLTLTKSHLGIIVFILRFFLAFANVFFPVTCIYLLINNQTILHESCILQRGFLTSFRCIVPYSS